MNNFGVYHWRKWLRSLAQPAALFAVAVIVRQKTTNRLLRGLATATSLACLLSAYGTASKLLRPPPWRVERDAYQTVTDRVPLESADRVLDVGCGTGRSLVGLGPSLAESTSITGLDPFTDDVIFGNEPDRARTNARTAGIDPTVVVGDATDLPFADGSYDVVTVFYVLHDLPADDAVRALKEIRRVLPVDGAVGLVELPRVEDTEPVPMDYWEETVRDAGFAIESAEYRPWKDDERYVVLHATPSKR